MKFNKKYRFLLLAIPFFIIALLMQQDGYDMYQKSKVPAKYTPVKKLCDGFIGGGFRIFPVGWQQVVDFVGWVGCNLFQHISEVGERVKVVEFAACYQAVNNCGSFGSGFAAGKHPVLASNGYHPQGAFGKIVVNGKDRVINISHQCRPLVHRIGDGFAGRALGQHQVFPLDQIGPDFVKNQLGFRLSGVEQL